VQNTNYDTESGRGQKIDNFLKKNIFDQYFYNILSFTFVLHIEVTKKRKKRQDGK